MEIKLDRDIGITYSPQASKILKKDYWYLREAVNVDIRGMNKHYEFTIPQGYLTDGATVPRLVWAFVPLWDDCTTAVVIHDYLCNQNWIKIDGKLVSIDRRTSDDLFLAAMEFSGVSKIKRFIIYNFVRLHAELFNNTAPQYPEGKLEMERLIRENIQMGYYK